MVDTQGMTTPRPVKMQPTSTTTTPGSVHKEARGGVNHAHHSKEEVTIFNSNFNSNLNSNQPSLRDLVFGQAKINESLNRKLAANNKILESIHAKVETLSSAHKNQLSFNKMTETQLAQLAAAAPVLKTGRFRGNPNLPLKLQISYLPGGATFPGRLLELTMQEKPHTQG